MRSEKEKMLAGELYNGMDPELVAERVQCRRLLRELNGSDDPEARRQTMQKLLGSVGNASWIEPPFFCDYGTNLFIGERFYANFQCVILDCARVDIGDDVFFGPAVQLYTAGHPVLAKERIKGPEFALPIRIGSRVWMGGGAIVVPGVSIGEDTTIGAGSVVTRDIPAGVLAAGNPCRVLKTL